MRRVDFEKKKEEFFNWCRTKWDLTKEQMVYLWANYKYEIITLGPVAIAGLVKIVQSISRAHVANLEEEHRNLDIYDHSTCQYYHLKRAMTVQEQLELERRMSNGEKKGQILRDMGLI